MSTEHSKITADPSREGLRKWHIVAALLAVLILIGGIVAVVITSGDGDDEPALPVRGVAPALPADLFTDYEQVDTDPWEVTTWTQGLDTDPYDDNRLVVSEGTGGGQSRIWLQDRNSGRKRDLSKLPCYQAPRSVPDPLAPGTTITSPCVLSSGATFAANGGAIWQLTRSDGVAYARSSGDLSVQGTAVYGQLSDVDAAAVLGGSVIEAKESDAVGRQGWGACSLAGNVENPGGLLVTSDGTNRLTVRNVTDFSAGDKTLDVTLPSGKEVSGINELSCSHAFGADGVWANLYPSDQIAFISLADGKVKGAIDLGKLRADQNKTNPSAGLANGVAALNPVKDGFTELVVTGQGWNKLYHLSVPTSSGPSGRA